MFRSIIRFFNTGGLLKDSSTLFAGMAAINVCNLLFQILMGRCLKPQEYALLVALLGMFNILVVPLGVISSTVSRYASLLIQDGRKGDVRRLILYWLKFILIPGGILSLCCFCFPERVAGFVHLERTAPVFIFGAVILGAFIRPVLDGALLGLQCFKGWSISSSLGWSARLVVGGLLVLFVSPYAGWGLLGHGIGFYIAIVLGFYFVYSLLKGEQSSQQSLPKMHGYVFGSFFILLGFSCLMTGDVVLVKHLLPEAADDFSYAATLGRLVIFIPQALVASMFPKVVAEGGATRLQQSIFIKTLLMTLLATVAVATIFFFMVKFMLWFIYGINDPSDQLLHWSRMLTWIMVPVSLLSVTVRFALAQRKLRAVSVLPLAAICYISLSFAFGTDVNRILMLLGACTVLALLLCWYCMFGIRLASSGSLKH
jgi:O-antigen/teichoic acid export membrane protein